MSSPGTVNSVTLTGEIVGKVRLSYVPGGETMAEFVLSVSSKAMQDNKFQRVRFNFDVVVFGKPLTIENNAIKGAKVFIHGSLRQRQISIGNETFNETIVVGHHIVMLKPPDGKKTKEYE